MQNPLLIINARLHSYDSLQQILIDRTPALPQPQIVAVRPMTAPRFTAEESIDVAGDWVSLGGVDLQINGALGLAFPDLDLSDRRSDIQNENLNDESPLKQLQKISQFLWQQGIDAFLPTIVTTSIEKIHAALEAIERCQNLQSGIHNPQAQILGVHLEGPFLNPAKRGAHPAEYLLPLTLETVQQVLGDYAAIVKVITLAPELDCTGTAIEYLRSLNIIVSLGHSQATAAQAQQAFAQGATLVTHAFNAMPPLHHREPGLLGAALTYSSPHSLSHSSLYSSSDSFLYSSSHPYSHSPIMCGFIADGEHITPLMLDLLLRFNRATPPHSTSPHSPPLHSPPSSLFLVSDALSPLGLPDGTYPWDSRQIEVKHGTARLPDGTLSGTTRPLLAGVQNLVNWGIATVEEAIALATIAPRQAIGLPDKVAIDQPATLLRWHWHEVRRSLTWQRIPCFY